MKEGVRIFGFDRTKKKGGENKEKKQGENDTPNSHTEVKGKGDEGVKSNEDKNSSGQKLTENKERQTEENREKRDNRPGNPEEEGETSTSPNRYSTINRVCKQKKIDNLRVVITDPEIQAYREHIAEYAVICKFMGMWPTERALCIWIRQQWKPIGDVKLDLGAKGFFTVVFTNIEDKDRIFDGGPYFMASAGLYMRPWKPNIVPEK